MNRGVRLQSLTGLRAVAALAVFGVHITYFFRNSRAFRPIDDLTRQGAVGVSLFFVLSGFVLAWTHDGDNLAKRDFWRRRFARVFPAYVVAWLLAVLVIFDEARPGLGGNLGRGAFNLTLLQAWIPKATWFSGGNDVGWSLSAEVFFYASFPFIVAIVTKLSQTRRVVLITGCAVASVLVPVIVHPSTATIHGQLGVSYWLVYISPLVRILEFTAGVALACYMRAGGRMPVPLWAASTLAAVAYVIAGQVPAYLGLVAVTVIPFILLVGSCAEADRSGRRSPLRHRWAVLLGTWSYCFYLVHQLVIRVVAANVINHGVSLSVRVVVVGASLPVAWVAAYALWRYVEAPLEQRLRGARSRPEEIPALATLSAG